MQQRTIETCFHLSSFTNQDQFHMRSFLAEQVVSLQFTISAHPSFANKSLPATHFP